MLKGGGIFRIAYLWRIAWWRLVSIVKPRHEAMKWPARGSKYRKAAEARSIRNKCPTGSGPPIDTKDRSRGESDAITSAKWHKRAPEICPVHT